MKLLNNILYEILKKTSRLRFFGKIVTMFQTWWDSRQDNTSLEQKEIIAGLDIGSSAVKVIIAETDSSKQIKVVGLGFSPTMGVKKGMVVNVDQTVHAILKAVSEAEIMCNLKVNSAFVGIGGEHIRSLNSHGIVAVSKANSEITQKDVNRVLDASLAENVSNGKEIIHIIPQQYIVDNQSGIVDPIGLYGKKLEVEVHIVIAAITPVRNIINCVKRSGLSIQEIVLGPLSSSLAVMKSNEQGLGYVILDMGGGTTDIAVFYDGCIRHCAIIPLGGNDITYALAVGLRTSFKNAEEIKIKHGCTLNTIVDEDESLEINGVGGHPSRVVSRKFLCAFIETTVNEIFKKARREIYRNDCTHKPLQRHIVNFIIALQHLICYIIRNIS